MMRHWDTRLWQTVSPLADRALDLDPGARAAFLDSVRAEQPDVADAVERFLLEHDRMLASAFLDASPLVNDRCHRSRDRQSARTNWNGRSAPAAWARSGSRAATTGDSKAPWRSNSCISPVSIALARSGSGVKARFSGAYPILTSCVCSTPV